MVAFLIYLTTSRTYIPFIVCLYARYQYYPIESHLSSAIRVMQYFKGTTNVGLWHPKALHTN